MRQKVKVTRPGAVLCIGLSRAEKSNAMDIDLYLELADAYRVLNTDDSLRCGVLYGEGKHFVTLTTSGSLSPDSVRQQLSVHEELAHITVEVNLVAA